MGDKFRTIQNLEIIRSDLENNLIFVKGSVPGSKNSLVLIQKNAKKVTKPTTLEKIKKIQTQTIPSPSTKVKSKAPTEKELPTTKPEKKEVKK